jgi:hypothetical protein
VIIPAGELMRIRESMIVPDPQESIRKREMEKTMQEAAAKIKREKLKKLDHENRTK